MLRLPIYVGYVQSEAYNVFLRKGRHEGLISFETREKIQRRLKQAAFAPARKDISNDFPLRGFVTCGDCEKPLRSCWSKSGTGKRHAYYLCQKKSCDSYGKSVPSDKLEGEVGDIIKTLQPSRSLVGMVTHMFQHAWDQRRAQFAIAVKSARRQIKALEKQSEALLRRIVEADNTAVVQAYEGKLADIERSKVRLEEQAQIQPVQTGTFEEKLEPALQFLASPWKLWETGQVVMQRAVLRLAFAERLAYHQNTGARTPKTSIPFKALRDESIGGVCFGAPRRNRTGTPEGTGF